MGFDGQKGQPRRRPTCAFGRSRVPDVFVFRHTSLQQGVAVAAAGHDVDTVGITANASDDLSRPTSTLPTSSFHTSSLTLREANTHIHTRSHLINTYKTCSRQRESRSTSTSRASRRTSRRPSPASRQTSTASTTRSTSSGAKSRASGLLRCLTSASQASAALRSPPRPLPRHRRPYLRRLRAFAQAW